MYCGHSKHISIYLLCHCNSADEVLLKPSGAQLTVEFLEEHSFSVPVMVLRRDGLGMTLPPSSFSVSDVEHYIGKVLTYLELNVDTYSYLFFVCVSDFTSCIHFVKPVHFVLNYRFR